MGIPATKYTSPQEYLELERISKEKHEYFAGKVLAMHRHSRQGIHG
jgi:hypothetical protein